MRIRIVAAATSGLVVALGASLLFQTMRGNGEASTPPGAAGGGVTSAPLGAAGGQPSAVPTPTDDPPFTYVEEFLTPVALGTWPANGSAPRGYRSFRSYPEGTSHTYYPSQVLAVHDGVLDWYCHGSMGAAVLPFGYSGFLYGTYTVRMRTDDFPGYRAAFLLWPNSGQWTHELDGPEEDTAAPNPYPAVLLGTTPTWRFDPPTHIGTPASWHDAAFHDYTWQWSPDAVSFYQDGNLVTRVTDPDGVPQVSMHPVLQVQFSNALRGAAPDPSISGHVYVDRIMYDPSYTIAIPTN